MSADATAALPSSNDQTDRNYFRITFVKLGRVRPSETIVSLPIAY